MPASIALRSSSFQLNQIIGIATISLLALACGPAQETVSTGPLLVASPSPVSASVGERYEFLLEAAGGTPPVRWSIVEGALPEGLSLDAATGLIAGTPASAGMVIFSIAATDSAAATLRTSLRISVLGGSRCRLWCGHLDAGASTDAGTSDAGTSDAGTSDAGTSDAGTSDAGPSDAGPSDAGTSDAGTSDAGKSDAGTSDAGTSDAGTSDASATALSADPSSLPVATADQVPLTAAYDLLGVPAMAAGSSYLDPTSAAKIYKLTSSSFPAASATWSHDYSEGGDEISLPYAADGKTRAILLRAANLAYWLVDFTPGAGVSNPRLLTGAVAPFSDLAFAFSNNPATPWYAYVSDGAAIRRIDIRTLTEAPGNHWPQTGETWGCWLHQSANDGLFVWMRGGTGDTVVIFEPASGTKKTYVNSLINEPRMDRAGRYVAMNLNTPANSLAVWDWNLNGIAWSTPGDPGIPFAHGASLQGRWMGVDWNESYPGQYTVFLSGTANSARHLAGAANGTLVHGSGNWIQYPANPDDQWALFDSYDGVRPMPSNVAWLAPGGMVYVNASGGRRLLGHEYNTSSVYTLQGFAKPSSDGRYVLFSSDMDGAGRTDLFLAEAPAR
jgi:hypothetical protein